jgi:hypothetical protein
MRICGSNGINMAPGSKNAASGGFLSCVIDGMVGRGRARILEPVMFTVSALEHIVVGVGGIVEQRLPDLITQN